jgi:hypothetical protein
MMKHFLAATAFGVSVLTFNVALAHGEKPKHGGTVQVASDLAFELVPKGDIATIYVEDHGKPFSTAGMAGKLTVLNGTEKSEAELRPVGDNRLEAQGVKLVKGSKAVASLTTPKKKTVNVRFAVK